MNTTKLNKNNARARAWIDSYNKSDYHSVNEIYRNCSSCKRAIEREILSKMDLNDFTSYKVLSGNSSFFTCGYLSSDKKYLYIETFANTYEIEL